MYRKKTVDQAAGKLRGQIKALSEKLKLAQSQFNKLSGESGEESSKKK